MPAAATEEGVGASVSCSEAPRAGGAGFDAIAGDFGTAGDDDRALGFGLALKDLIVNR